MRNLSEFVYAEVQHHLRLTQLHLEPEYWPAAKVQQLSQLSMLENLERLVLRELPVLPGGLPSQLVKLTCLSVTYKCFSNGRAAQFQHLSNLTALQVLEYWNGDQGLTSQLCGIAHLPQLTMLSLGSRTLSFSATSIRNWACRTGLQALELALCHVQPEALAAFLQLRMLRLADVRPLGDASPEQLLAALAQLQHLTELTIRDRGAWTAHLPATAFTAITASTNLCVLKLGLPWGYDLRGKVTGEACVMFKPGLVYPHLRVVDLEFKNCGPTLLDELRLQHLCSCCPALESLMFAIFNDVCNHLSDSVLTSAAAVSLDTLGDQETLSVTAAVAGSGGRRSTADRAQAT
jgi:hypothetical protein